MLLGLTHFYYCLEFRKILLSSFSTLAKKKKKYEEEYTEKRIINIICAIALFTASFTLFKKKERICMYVKLPQFSYFTNVQAESAEFKFRTRKGSN